MKYAPIVLFAFNRLEPLKRCVASLSQNSEAAGSDLIVYVDGPRAHKEGEAEKVEAVREYVKTITGFKSVAYHFSDVNKKLGPSIIAGVTEVINQYGRAIVIEDDLIASENMLAYVNQGLEKYANVQEVFSISAYTNRVKIPTDYLYDAYFCPRSTSWGWATWKDRWDSVDWELKDWSAVEQNAKAFNRWGGSDCFGMLKAWHEGRNQSWAIRFCYAQFVHDKQSLFPSNPSLSILLMIGNSDCLSCTNSRCSQSSVRLIMKGLMGVERTANSIIGLQFVPLPSNPSLSIISKIDNEGFDGSGTNCKQYNRFKFDFDVSGKKYFVFPDELTIISSIRRSALSYHTIPIRIYSRLMNIYLNYKHKDNKAK